MKTFIFEANNAIETGHPHEKQYNDKKRKCVECRKPLSGYNHDDRCFSHRVTEEEVFHKRRRTAVKQRMDEETKKVKLWMQTY